MKEVIREKVKEYEELGLIVPQKILHDSFIDDYRGEEVVMVHFDACRYDTFEKLYPEYFEGELLKTYNGGVKFTFDWFSLHCSRDMHCTLYTASSVNLAKWMDIHGTYDPTEYFRDILGMSVEDYSEELGICLPKQINEVALEEPDDTYHYFVRYLKPHPPLVHPDSHLKWTLGDKKWNVNERIEAGETSIEEIKEAYELNTRIAFEGAVDLYKQLEEPDNFFITADHGEALGENDEWWHGRALSTMQCLTNVPWFEVEDLV